MRECACACVIVRVRKYNMTESAFVVVNSVGIYDEKDLIYENRDKLNAKLIFVRNHIWDEQVGVVPGFYDWEYDYPASLRGYWDEREIIVAEITNSHAAAEAFLQALVDCGALKGKRNGGMCERVAFGFAYKYNYVSE